MSGAKSNASLKKFIATLRHRVAQGDASAMCDLGMWLQEGFQDRKGRRVLRSNPTYAFRLLKAAAEQGFSQAFSSLGYSYDLGLGTSKNKREAAGWYARAYRDGQSLGAANLATIYRDRGNLPSMLRWWLRAAAMGDGDSMVDAAYCYQYGIGAHGNITSARKLYRRAIATKDISMWGREEALYQLSLSYIDTGRPRLALPLLKRAAKDGDYPEAGAVLERSLAKGEMKPCRCRRFITKDLQGHARCLVHPRKRHTK